MVFSYSVRFSRRSTTRPSAPLRGPPPRAACRKASRATRRSPGFRARVFFFGGISPAVRRSKTFVQARRRRIGKIGRHASRFKPTFGRIVMAVKQNFSKYARPGACGESTRGAPKAGPPGQSATAPAMKTS